MRVFITGGASGLGLALAQRYVRSGARVCIGDVNDERGQHAEQTLNVLYRHCDVTSEADLQAVADHLVNQWGGVDVVVNNAGVAHGGAIEDVTLDSWDKIININLLGVVRGCRVFTPIFKRQGSGRFINIASMAGLLNIPLMSPYNTTKAAVVSLSETLQNELATYGVKVSVVCPSFFKTNLMESFNTPQPGLVSMAERLMHRSPLSADDVARYIVDSDEFYVIPHPEARLAFLLKRYLPRSWYVALQKKMVARVLRHRDAPAST